MTVKVLLEPVPKMRRRQHGLTVVRFLLLMIGVGLLGYTGWVYWDTVHSQEEGERVLDSRVDQTPESTEQPTIGVPGGSRSAEPKRKAEEALIGRIVIPRLKVRAVIREGTDSKTLRRAVGHVEGTAFPGEDGNVGLAAHRDTFFSGLRDAKKGDVITLETMDREFEYKIDSLKIVSPNDVEVLAPTQEPALTLVTCYPFTYVGNAPRRFIVRARRVSANPRASQGS